MGLLKRLRSKSKGHQEAEELIEEVQFKPLNSALELDQLETSSKERVQVIFKHSTRCGVSSMVLRRFKRQEHEVIDGMDFYMLDVIGNRELSNAVAERYGIFHQSPQLLLIKEGVCVLNDSHHGIANCDLTSFI